MNQRDGMYQELRDTWDDHNHRQEFEHDLINRKTTWLLTAQSILFAAYGVTFGSRSTADELDRFRTVVAWSGLLISVIVLLGVLMLINSKRLSWKDYRAFFKESELKLPGQLKGSPLQWGVRTANTHFALLPDVLLPLVFIVAWWVLIS